MGAFFFSFFYLEERVQPLDFHHPPVAGEVGPVAGGAEGGRRRRRHWLLLRRGGHIAREEEEKKKRKKTKQRECFFFDFFSTSNECFSVFTSLALVSLSLSLLPQKLPLRKVQGPIPFCKMKAAILPRALAGGKGATRTAAGPSASGSHQRPRALVAAAVSTDGASFSSELRPLSRRIRSN